MVAGFGEEGNRAKAKQSAKSRSQEVIFLNQNKMQLSKAEAVATGGMVATKHPLATVAGLEMLTRGGNAVDAAVAAAFASGVVEPWMSGIGGGGYTVIQMASGESVVIDGPLTAPAAAAPDMFPLGEGTRDELFTWPAVAGDANLYGWRAVAVPGFTAGMCLALERYGRLDLETVLQPAIRLARDGFPVTWYQMLKISQEAASIARFPETAGTFFKGGFPRVPPDRIVQPDLADTLTAIARGGPDALYRGPIGAAIARAMRHNGGLMTADDLAACQARAVPPLALDYHGHTVLAVPELSGGVSMAQILGILNGFHLGSLGHNTAAALHLFAESARLAFADRLAFLGQGQPWEQLLAPDHLSGSRQRIDLAAASAAPPPSDPPGTSTTHLCAADRDGNLVSCTQTLLSLFGSRVTVPGTGILLNNGMYWFNPVPGHPNSPGPGKRPLSNMSPAVVLRGGRPWLAIGASGGRKIICANAQIIMNAVDHGMGVQAAIAAPRVDASTPPLIADQRLPGAALDGLARLGHPLQVVAESFYPSYFASPTGVLIDQATGTLRGGTDPMHVASAAGIV